MLGLPSLPSFANCFLSCLETALISLGSKLKFDIIHCVLSSAACLDIGPLLSLGIAVNIIGLYLLIKLHNLFASGISGNLAKVSSGKSFQ